ncbi:MAG: CBS domain-containing protein [Myxococcales bacterium]|nr:CBS domain-containing protein [Myxococcales bacterium]
MTDSFLRVSEVMTTAVVLVNTTTTAREAAEILTRSRINGAPVLDEHRQVVGIVSKTDLLDARNYPTDREALVGDLMTRIVLAIRPSQPAMAAVRLMVTEDVHRVVVINEDGTLAGVVAPMDVMRAIAQGRALGEASQAASTDFVSLTWVKR